MKSRRLPVDARDCHWPGGVHHGVVDPDALEELAAAGRVAEEVTDRLLVRLAPGAPEAGDVAR